MVTILICFFCIVIVMNMYTFIEHCSVLFVSCTIMSVYVFIPRRKFLQLIIILCLVVLLFFACISNLLCLWHYGMCFGFVIIVYFMLSFCIVIIV